MLTLSYNVLFPAGADLGAITDITGGATVHDDGTITAAADTDTAAKLFALGGDISGVSDTLLFRVTARTDIERVRWTARLLDILQGYVTRVTTSDKGFWGPTGEYEASWVIETNLDRLPHWLAAELEFYLHGAAQEALYVELGYRVFIADRGEVAKIPAALTAARAG